MKLLRKLLFIALALAIIWRVERFCHKKTDGFQMVKIQSHLPVSPEWATPQPTAQELADLQDVLSQPFFYLNSGGQCYAFLSQDGKVVLKFFKMHHLRQYPFFSHIPLPGVVNEWRNQFLHFQKCKLDKIFSSSQIAYTLLKKQTGLLYLNLNPNPEFGHLHLTLIDKIGVEHRINLQNIPFALQHKADNPFDMLSEHLLHQDIAAAKDVVRDIFHYLSARTQKGILDNDPALHRNVGLLKDQAISIDIGSFVMASAPMTLEEEKRELVHDTRKMRRWLQKRSSPLANYLESLIEEYSAQ